MNESNSFKVTFFVVRNPRFDSHLAGFLPYGKIIKDPFLADEYVNSI